MERLKCRLLEVVEENNMLHDELKRSVVDEIVKATGSAAVPPLTPVVSLLTPPTSVPPTLSHFNAQKWHTELVLTLQFTLHKLITA